MTLQLRWKKYDVTLETTTRVVGGIPTDPKLIAAWIAARMKGVSADERAKLAEATIDALPAAVEEKAEAMWTTFKADKSGPYLEPRQVKAMFKECSNILRSMLEKGDKAAQADAEAEEDDDEIPAPEPATKKPAPKTRKSKFTNLKAKLAERLFVVEAPVYFLRDGKQLAKVDGTEERAIHVMTPMGPRNALKRFDFIEPGATVSFSLKVLDDGLVTQDLIEVLLEYAGQNGLGADRSQGSGQFKVTKFTVL